MPESSRLKALKIDVFDYPSVVWCLISNEPSRISAKNLYCQSLQSLCYISAVTVWVYVHCNFRDGLRKRMYFETECEMTLQGHKR